jgi:hypothetical protein
MTDSAKNQVVKKALRNARRALRSLDTAGEVVERRLDRLIARKTYPSGPEWDPLIREWNTYKNLAPQLEKALADAIQSSNF